MFGFRCQLSLKVIYERRSSLKHFSENLRFLKYLPIKLGINKNTFSFMFAKQIACVASGNSCESAFVLEQSREDSS